MIKELIKIITKYFLPMTMFVCGVFYGLFRLNIILLPWYKIIFLSMGMALFLEFLAMIIAFITVKKDIITVSRLL